MKPQSYKKSLLMVAGLLAIPFFTNAQAPMGISYQALAYNAGGSPVANATVGVQISILDNSATGPVVFAETHTPQTNAQGLFNLNIGQGTPVSGSFSGISWGQNLKFIKVEVDPNGGTSYTASGTNQLMSVPYALYAETVNPAGLNGASSQISSPDGAMVVVYTSTNAYGFAKSSTNNPQWYPYSLSGTVIGAIATDSMIVVYTTTDTYGFAYSSTSNPQWYPYSMSGTVAGIKAGHNRIVVYTSTDAYGFGISSTNNPQWYPYSLSGNPLGVGAAGGRVVIYTTFNAYGFDTSSTNNPQWYPYSISGTPIGIVPE